MKRIARLIGLFAFIFLLTGGCNKIDWLNFPHPPLSKNQCDVAEYRLSIYDNLGFPFLFKKTYDNAGDIKEINASFFNIRPIDQLIHYNLLVLNKGQKIYLVDKTNPADTILVITLNKQGRVQECVGKGDYFPPNSGFLYRNNRLVSFSWWGIRDSCDYDSYGNILSIQPAGNFYPGSKGDGTFFEYDYSRKASQQFYLDEITNMNDGFSLLRYLGFFPELNPIHLRTAVNVGTEPGHYYWYKKMINHQVDNNGKLLGYDVGTSFNNGDFDFSFHVTLTWNCNLK